MEQRPPADPRPAEPLSTRDVDEKLPEKFDPNFVHPPGIVIRKPGWAMSEAIRTVDARVANRMQPGYLIVAEQFGLKRGSLKTMYGLYRKGQVVLLNTRAEMVVSDKKHEMEVTLNLIDEIEAMLNISARKLLEKSKVYQAKGKYLAYRDMGLPLVLQDLRHVKSLRNLTEQGYMAILEKVMKEKNAKASVADVPTTVQQLSRAEQQRKAAEALQRQIDAREATEAEAQAQPGS